MTGQRVQSQGVGLTGLISRTTRWLAIAGATLYCMGIIVLAALIMMGDFNTGDREPGRRPDVGAA